MAAKELVLTVELPDDPSVSSGSPLVVEVRDTSLADAPAVTLERRRTAAPARARSVTVTFSMETIPDGTTAWAHLDADRDGRVSPGDYITVQSYPVLGSARQALTLRLKKV
jgi:hypothetical protein